MKYTKPSTYVKEHQFYRLFVPGRHLTTILTIRKDAWKSHFFHASPPTVEKVIMTPAHEKSQIKLLSSLSSTWSLLPFSPGCLALNSVAETLLLVVTIIGGAGFIVEVHINGVHINGAVRGIIGGIFWLEVNTKLFSHKLTFFHGNMTAWDPVIDHDIITCKMHS